MKLPKLLREMTGEQKSHLCRILIAAAAYIAALLLPLKGVARLGAFLVPYLIVGWGVIREAAENIAHGEIFDENFLMCVASIGAFASGQFPEAVAVMLFYQVGELFEDLAVEKSRRSIATLMNIRPDCAHVERGGTEADVDPKAVAVGEIILVRPGERMPLDGVVLEGTSTLDTAPLTGESVPRDVGPGAEVISGCINLSGALRVRVSKPYGESTVARILQLVENASSRKAKYESFIEKFAAVYTPVVCGCALLLAVVPPLFLGNWREWISRALLFLVVSCPCALVISVPLSFFAGIGGASARGILIKGGNYMETLAKVDRVVFDKTGTLTKGTFAVTGLFPEKVSGEELLETAALAERESNHPLSAAVRAACDATPDPERVRNIREIPGMGVCAEVDGRSVCVGNGRLMEHFGIPFAQSEAPGTVLYVAREGASLGCIVVSDVEKAGARDAIAALRRCGIRECVMLTGDRLRTAEAVASDMGIDRVFAELLPEDKVRHVEDMLSDAKAGRLAFVGDGINDAPVLMRADVGIAMGAMGQDAAIEAADVVLMDDDPRKIAAALRIARRTMRIVRENVVFALAVKLAVMVLGALGWANMGMAVFADVGVSVIAILNAMRALHCGTR